jgi:hypothetical protein
MTAKSFREIPTFEPSNGWILTRESAREFQKTNPADEPLGPREGEHELVAGACSYCDEPQRRWGPANQYPYTLFSLFITLKKGGSGQGLDFFTLDQLLLEENLPLRSAGNESPTDLYLFSLCVAYPTLAFCEILASTGAPGFLSSDR